MRTERDAIVDVTASWFSHSEWSLERFAFERLAPALSAAGLIEPFEEPTDLEVYQKSRKAWSMRVSRIFNGSQPFPLEWKWVWLACLPDDYRARARQQLLAMAGCFDVRLPEMVSIVGISATQARISDVMREFSEFVAASGPAHDGRYDRLESAAAVDRMLLEGAEACSAMLNEMIAISTGTGRPLPLLVLSMMRRDGSKA